MAWPGSVVAQQYVKTYSASAACSPTPGNLDMQMITRSGKTPVTFYIAGMQDNSIYMTEVDDMGVVLQEKLVGLNSNKYYMHSMITDDDGNIVIVGHVNQSYPYFGFLLKISPALSVLLHRTYTTANTTGTSQFYLSDIKDNRASGAYYISGASSTSNTLTRNEGLLLRVSRTTGTILTITNSNSVYDGADGYDALVLNPSAVVNIPSTIHAVGMLGGQALSTFRPWINRHNFGNLSFIAGMRYLKDRNNSNIARIYPSSLINDGSNMLNCWNGDVNGTSVALNAGMSSVRTATLAPNWQTEYMITPKSQDKFVLTKVATDLNGYVAQGSWWDGNGYLTGFFGEIILLRTTKAGLPLWSRKIQDVFVNSFHHNASFVIEGNSIFTVGLKRADANNAFSRGVLVRIPLADGQMDTLCAPIQVATTKNYIYNAPENITNIVINTNDFESYFPINCTKTDAVKNCDICDKIPTVPSADFDLTGMIQSGNTTNYKVTASNFLTAPDSRWIVSQDNGSGGDLAGSVWTSAIGGFWGTNSPTSFGGYLGTENGGTSTNFLLNHKYRFRHILSTTNNCGASKSDTVVKVIFMCPACKPVKGSSIVTTEKPGTQSDPITSEDKQSLRMLPNPVTGSSFTLENLSSISNKVTVKIIDMYGRQVANKTFTSKSGINLYNMDARQLANGSYTAIIFSEEKTLTQKFVVSKK